MNIWNLFELLTMFEELERFPIKAGFSQQASCQICFSIISFNWDPRFCETYTGATCQVVSKLKFLSWLPLGAVARSFHLLGIFGICFPPPGRPTLVIWYPSHRPLAMLAPCNHLPAGRPSAICTLAKGEDIFATICHPRDIFGSICWESLARGDPWEFCMG